MTTVQDQASPTQVVRWQTMTLTSNNKFSHEKWKKSLSTKNWQQSSSTPRAHKIVLTKFNQQPPSTSSFPSPGFGIFYYLRIMFNSTTGKMSFVPMKSCFDFSVNSIPTNFLFWSFSNFAAFLLFQEFQPPLTYCHRWNSHPQLLQKVHHALKHLSKPKAVPENVALWSYFFCYSLKRLNQTTNISTACMQYCLPVASQPKPSVSYPLQMNPQACNELLDHLIRHELVELLQLTPIMPSNSPKKTTH